MVGLHEELVGKVRLVGVDHDRLGQVLQDLDDGVVVLAIPTLLFGRSVRLWQKNNVLGCVNPQYCFVQFLAGDSLNL